MEPRASGSEQEAKPRRRWLRWLLGVGLGVPLGLVVVVVVVVVVVCWIPAVSQLVVETALARWDEAMPGAVEHGEMSGSLGGGLVIADFELRDAEDRPLVHAASVELDIAMLRLLLIELELERGDLRELEVWADHQWGDLAPPPVEPREEPSWPEGYGPKLPVQLRARIVIDGGVVRIADEELIRHERLELRVAGKGRHASAAIELDGVELPQQDLRVDSLGLVGRWDAPVATLERVDLASPLGSAHLLEPARFDAAERSGSLAVELDGRPEALAERVGLDGLRGYQALTLRLRGQGDPERVEVEGVGALDSALRSSFVAHLTPRTDPETGRRELGVELDAHAAGGLLHGEQHPLALTLAAELGQVVDDGFDAEARIVVRDETTGEQLSLDARGAGSSLSPPRGRAELELRGPGLRARAEVSSDVEAGQRGSLRLNIDELGEPLAIVARFVEQPKLALVRGRLELDASCSLAARAPANKLRCPVFLALDELSGYQTRLAHAELDGAVRPLGDPPSFGATLELRGLEREQLRLDTATVRVSGTPKQLRVTGRGRGEWERFELDVGLSFGERQRIALDELELVSTRGERPARLVLVEPAHVVIAPDEIEVHELRLQMGEGQIAVDGRLGLSGRRSDIRASIHEIDLGRVAGLIPGPHMGGRVSAEASFVGSFEAPAGHARVDAEGLELDVLVVDELELDASLCGASGGEAPPGCAGRRAGDLSLSLRSAGPLIEQVELDAELPLRFAGGFGLRRGRELSAALNVRGLNLVELGGYMPRTPSWWRQVPADAAAPEGEPRLIPGGRVELELALSGTSEHPRAKLTGIARELVIDRTELGSALVLVELDEDDLGVEAEVKPGLGSLELSARLPVEVDLARGRFEWRREAEHRVALELRDVELAAVGRTLGPKLPMLAEVLERAELDALLSATIQAQGPASAPELAAVVRGYGLRHRGELLGDARVLVDHRDARTEAELRLEGPLAERLDARVELPLSVSLDREPIWALDTSGPMSAEAHGYGLELASLERHVGEIPVDATAEFDIELDGSLAEPELGLDGRLAGLRLHADPIGDLTVHAELDRSGVELESDLLRSGTHLAALELEIPLVIDLRELDHARVAWNREGRHRVLATGRHLDEELLAALTGRELRVFEAGDADYGRGELGADARFDFAGGGRASDFKLEGSLHGEVVQGDEPQLVLDGRLDLDESEQSAELTITPSTCDRLALTAGLTADVAALLAGTQAPDEIPFELELDAPDFDLASLGPLLPPSLHDPEGTLHAKLSGGGKIAAPRLQGGLDIRDGALTVIAMRERFTGIGLELALDNERVELRELELVAGAGKLSGRGKADVRPGQGVSAQVELDVVELPLIRPGLPAMTLDTGVDIELELDSETTRLDVVLSEPAVEVALQAAQAPKRVPSSDEVELAGAAPEELVDERAQRSQASEVAKVEHHELHMRLELGDPLEIHGPRIDMLWTGAVVIDRRGPAVELGGELEARRGRIELLGHSFDLRRGVVSLPDDGSLVPYLDIVAVTSTQEAEVTVTIRGRATKPELHFSSSTGLTEVQILTLLITGETTMGEGNGEVQAKAANLLAAVSSPQLQKQLDRYLGIDRAQISFGDSLDQPILSLGKRVSRDVFVETTYHHNAPDDENTAQIGVEYDFAPRWSLETYFGDAAVGGVGVYWTRSFGAMPWKEDEVEDEGEDEGEDDGEDSDQGRG